MRNEIYRTMVTMIRISLFSVILIGPMCAMAISKDRGFNDDSSAVGLVLLNSIQRG